MNDNYDDIIHLPHHTSRVFPRMSAENRAAQFAPFAALAGHEAAINEVARLTDDFVELSEMENNRLNRQIAYIQSRLSDSPSVIVTYFVPDAYKLGGCYHTVEGRVKEVDVIGKCITLQDCTEICLANIQRIVIDMLDGEDE